MAGDEILSVNDIEVTEVENAVEDLREALKGMLQFVYMHVLFFACILSTLFCFKKNAYAKYVLLNYSSLFSPYREKIGQVFFVHL